MIDSYAEKGEALWDCFNSPKEKKLWLYEEIAKILREKLNSPIIGELEAVSRKAERALLQ